MTYLKEILWSNQSQSEKLLNSLFATLVDQTFKALQNSNELEERQCEVTLNRQRKFQ